MFVVVIVLPRVWRFSVFVWWVCMRVFACLPDNGYMVSQGFTGQNGSAILGPRE